MAAITQQQVENTLNLSGVFSLINGAASLTDISPWASLGATSAKMLLQIKDPTGDIIYENSGYLTGDYSSPDLDVFNSVPTFSFTLPQDINGAYLQGSYTINISLQIISGAGTQTFSLQRFENVCSCCNGIVANVNPQINYLNAQVTVVDNTQYGNYLSVANTLTLYPDPTTGQTAQSQTFSGNPATLIWQPPMGQKTYTGNWKWTLSSILVYIDPVTQAQTTCLVTGSGVFEVNQNPICKVLCFINNYVVQVQLAQKNSLVNAGLMERQLLQAQGYFALLLGQNECGNNAQYYTEMIYRLIGVMNPNDSGCGCGCGGTDVTPLIPTQSINGTNGIDGLSFLQGTGVPAGGFGVLGDSYLNSSTGNIYKKTGASSWSLTLNIIGATGATGATGTTGAAGADGVAVLYNSATNQDNGSTTGSFVTLDSYTLPINQLANTGDEIRIHGVFFVGALPAASGTRLARITFATNDVFSIPLDAFPSNASMEVNVRIYRTSNTTVNYETYTKQFTNIGGSVSPLNLEQRQTINSFTVSALDANTMVINAQGKSEINSGIGSEALEVTFYKFKT